MTTKAIAAAAAFIGCALLLSANAETASQPRVYPTPKRMELTGGVSSAKLRDTKFRKVGGLGDEGYRIIVKRYAITVEASAKAGGFYALQTLRQLASGGAVLCCTVEDSPDVPLRGVVEGFYGRPWGTEGRLDLMDFMGRY